MKGNQPRGRLWQKARLAALTLVAVGVTGPACLSRPLQPEDPRTTSTIIEKLTESAVNKIDLLLAIDNSRSMADKQKILQIAVPDLVGRLVNPLCVDAMSMVPISSSNQPTDPKAACPVGSIREFEPILDIHIGIVDSSLGGHGADACKDSVPDTADCGAGVMNTSNNDHGHLITRKDPCLADQVPTYNNGLGFLAWDPNSQDVPPGETDPMKLNDSITELVTGVGQIGCGFEAQNEGWFRFLVDPSPYLSIAVDPKSGNAVKTGRDDVLLKQRSDFLRPSSLLAVIVLTDENDCSAREGGEYYLLEQLQSGMGNYYLPPARTECASNPNDKCCFSCAQDPGSCPKDPGCPAPQGTGPALTGLTDNQNLRCWDNKRRFGIDFLYPWQRYVNALSQPSINPNSADLSLGGQAGVPNPVFSDLQPNDNDSTVRTSDLVFLAGIVGVPWQDIARDPKDLTKGYKAAVGPDGKNELTTPDANGQTTWDIILGDPDTYKPPTDPLMLEQIDPRMTGAKNPVTGDAIAAPTAPNGTNPINGHEWTISGRDDLQYACIFPLLMPKDCSKGDPSCDCEPMNADDAQNPLCEPNPGDMNNHTLQARAKGYPGTRHLQILKGLGPQGIVASVCPAQTSDTTKADFGYRPAVGAIIDRLKTKLGGQCLPRTLTPDADGNIPCLIIEATKTNKCDCNATARQPVPAAQEQAVEGAKADPNYKTDQWNCFCEITQTTNPDPTKDVGPRHECQNDVGAAPQYNGKPVNGWCYVDDTTAPPIGEPKIVEKCPATEKRIVRFVGAGKGAPGATLFITCSGEN